HLGPPEPQAATAPYLVIVIPGLRQQLTTRRSGGRRHPPMLTLSEYMKIAIAILAEAVMITLTPQRQTQQRQTWPQSSQFRSGIQGISRASQDGRAGVRPAAARPPAALAGPGPTRRTGPRLRVSTWLRYRGPIAPGPSPHAMTRHDVTQESTVTHPGDSYFARPVDALAWAP